MITDTILQIQYYITLQITVTDYNDRFFTLKWVNSADPVITDNLGKFIISF